nr:MAG TPA: hypothetical protein [Inoviridae sp.]
MPLSKPPISDKKLPTYIIIHLDVNNQVHNQ